ncbi:MAG: hypothetical protein FD134_2372 [Gallionellaceae bacterium]|nr:MAG: hypothetical protein FD134_2372 [Gallionellaceae bacterium]
MPLPQPRPLPAPIPFPINLCAAVSGRYSYVRPVLPKVPPTIPTPLPTPIALPSLLSLTVRVDVDRFYPQHRISIEVSRRFPRTSAHVIAEVVSDQCVGFNHRIVTANITYRDGDATLLPGTTVVFEASRRLGRTYSNYTVTLSGAGIADRTYLLRFDSRYFDPVEFEVDCVANADTPTTTVNTAAHPNRPVDLPAETLSLTTIYQRAGFDARMSPNANVIPTTDAGANGTWSDSEMHNAMVTYWSRFANKPQWALWVLFAARHDIGRGLGGVMFDDIGPNHRQGTAIFTDSFIQDAPLDDANAVAWRQRMVFWTATHEMGHAFNLAHAWQKSLGGPQGPWIPLVDEPESRSFMNYPYNVAGGQAAFFSDFRFRFSDQELLFMRHAPRRFVQMGNSDWFVNHGFEAPKALAIPSAWSLMIRPNRANNTFSFMEPVAMEFKLTNISGAAAMADDHLLHDGRHITVFVQREGGATRQWRSMVTKCHREHAVELKAGTSLYGSHIISTSGGGWLIDEPGFYKVQAAIGIGDDVVVSNVLRLYVATPTSADANQLAGDFFTEDVGRALVFGGAPALSAAMVTLEAVASRCAASPAALYAAMALSSSRLRNYKLLDVGADRASLVVRSIKPDVDAAVKAQFAALIDAPDLAAETLGHIACFEAYDRLAIAMATSGNEKGAKKVLQASVGSMKKRGVLDSVVKITQDRIDLIK